MADTYTIKPVSEAEFAKLEKALLPVRVPLEQSPLWGAFDDSIAGREFLGSFGVYDGETFIALFSATLYRQKGRDWIWIKHGPLFASMPNTDVVQKMCTTLKTRFATTYCSSESPARTENQHSRLEQSSRSKDTRVVKPVFIRLSMPTKSAPLVLPFEHTMYDQTVIVDVTQSEDDILAGMSQSGRRSLRSAQKHPTTITEITKNAAGVFEKQCFPILQETGARDGFGIHPLQLYLNLLEKLGDCARLYVANVDGKVEAWAITTEYKQQAMYYYGGSSAKARETDAAYLLHWEIMKAMKSRGNVSYDFMGIAGKNYSGLKNVTQFKIKFSKNIVDIPFTYDLPLQPLKYRSLSLAIKLNRTIRSKK